MKKFLVFMLAMLWMSVAAFSQITISQEAAVAKYESDKRVKAAEADKIAGVAEQNATIEVSKAKGES